MKNIKKSPEYCLISRYYNYKIAERSGRPYMDHINQGLFVLEKIGLDEKTLYKSSIAYCLHPIFQNNEDWDEVFGNSEFLIDLAFDGINHEAVALAVEYRNIANSYLSQDKLEECKTHSLLQKTRYEVPIMLAADKIQNYKDFLKYHKQHPRYNELDQYFNNWFELILTPKHFVESCINDLNRLETC